MVRLESWRFSRPVSSLVSLVEIAKHVTDEPNGLFLAGLELFAGEGFHHPEAATIR
jgi:hypothetical protein